LPYKRLSEMEKYEQVIDILEQEAIPDEDKEVLKRIATEDIEIKNFISIHLKLKRIFNSSCHLDMEILAEFILYYDGDLDVADYMPQITDKIEDHLADCSVCNNLYLKFNEEFQQVDNFVSKTMNDNEDFELQIKSPDITKSKRNNFKTALTAFLLLVIAYFGMMITNYYSTPSYKKNIFEFEVINNSLIQSRDTKYYKQGLIAFEKENYDVAIGLLMEDIILNENDGTIFYSHYLLGISYIKSSENNIIGTFKSYNHLRINEAIHHLMIFIENYEGTDNERTRVDAHYYIAKAYLSIDAIEEAKTHLQIVKENRGKYYSDAVEILNYFKNDDKFKSANNK